MTEKSKDKVYEDSISNWPEEERPRERLLKSGPHTLTNAELLAILLRVGVKGKSAVDLARQIIREAKGLRGLACCSEYKIIFDNFLNTIIFVHVILI